VAENKPNTLSLKFIATELDLPRSTALAICVTLVQTEMISRDADGRYGMGAHTVAIASRYLSDPSPLENLAEGLKAVPEIQAETIVISVLDGPDVVYVACRTGTRPIAVHYQVGMRLPAHCAASGKAMLSLLDESEVIERLGEVDLRVRSTGKARSLNEMMKELRTTRKRGYAIDNEEVARGMCCFGAAIADGSGKPVTGVSVTCVKAALDEHHYEIYPEAVVRLAKRLSATGRR
jgi:DNA-binding IclR family transcriptional regulator